jgi:hypothetical protein
MSKLRPTEVEIAGSLQNAGLTKSELLSTSSNLLDCRFGY